MVAFFFWSFFNDYLLNDSLDYMIVLIVGNYYYSIGGKFYRSL